MDAASSSTRLTGALRNAGGSGPSPPPCGGCSGRTSSSWRCHPITMLRRIRRPFCWRTRRPDDRSYLSDAGGKGGPALSAGTAGVRHGCGGAMGRGSAEGKLRRTPTWRAKCRILGSGKTLEVRTLGRARRSLLPLALTLTAISKLTATNSQNKSHKVYTGSGHRCGVIPYSSVVWWIASRAEDEQLQGKNSLLRRGVLVLGESVWMRLI